MENNEIPFFGDGTIVGSYKPLFEYWKLLKEKHLSIDSSLLRPDDFKYVKELVEKHRKIMLQDLISELTKYFLNRIDCDLAKEAYRRALGIELSKEDACKKLAEILAGWLIEAANNTGLLKLSIPWRK